MISKMSPTQVECKALTAEKENARNMSRLDQVDHAGGDEHETLSVKDAEISDGAKLLFNHEVSL